MDYQFRVYKYEGDWVCEFPDLPGCIGVGETVAEAIEDGYAAKELWLDVYMRKHGRYPEASTTFAKEYSGRFVLRVPHSLHRDLVLRAEEENTSLNSLCLQYLSAGISKSSLEIKAEITYSINRKIESPEASNWTPLPTHNAPSRNSVPIRAASGI